MLVGKASRDRRPREAFQRTLDTPEILWYGVNVPLMNETLHDRIERFFRL